MCVAVDVVFTLLLLFTAARMAANSNEDRRVDLDHAHYLEGKAWLARYGMIGYFRVIPREELTNKSGEGKTLKVKEKPL